MITTLMATWTLTCALSVHGGLPRLTSENHLPTPQACEASAKICWQNYYAYMQKMDTGYDTLCKAQANHQEYFFHYSCDKALNCHRT